MKRDVSNRITPVLLAVGLVTFPAAAADTKSFDIAGVRLGNTVREAKAVLERGGFVVHADSSGWTYENWIKRARAGGNYFVSGNGVGRVWATKNDERVDIEIAPFIPGGLVKSISYSAPAAGRSRDLLIKDVYSRYGLISGNPQKTNILKVCAQDERPCGSPPRKDYISFQPDENMRISLYPGTSTYRAWEARFNSAVSLAAGPIKRSL